MWSLGPWWLCSNQKSAEQWSLKSEQVFNLLTGIEQTKTWFELVDSKIRIACPQPGDRLQAKQSLQLKEDVAALHCSDVKALFAKKKLWKKCYLDLFGLYWLCKKQWHSDEQMLLICKHCADSHLHALVATLHCRAFIEGCSFTVPARSPSHDIFHHDWFLG